jgi:hypothetical protein
MSKRTGISVQAVILEILMRAAGRRPEKQCKKNSYA